MSEKSIVIYSSSDQFIEKTKAILSPYDCIAMQDEFFLRSTLGDTDQDISIVISDDTTSVRQLENIIGDCRRIDPTAAHIHVCNEQDTERIRQLYDANVFEFIDKNINDGLFRKQCETVLNEDNLEKIVFSDRARHGEVSLELRMKYFEAVQLEMQRCYGRVMSKEEQNYFYPTPDDSHLISVDYILEELASSTDILIHNKSVLVVDDEAAVRKSIGRQLRRMGLNPSEASDGRQALVLTQLQSFDLMLLDVKMTDMNGDDLLRALKDSRKNVPTIMVSGNVLMDLVQRCFEYGAESYVIKPFTKELFMARVKKVLLKSILKKRFETYWQAFLRLKLGVRLRL